MSPRKLSQGDKQAISFAVTFACLALASVALLLHPFVSSKIVVPFTDGLVTVCAGLINLFGGHAVANGRMLSFATGGGAVMVANGCNAVEVSCLLASAIIAWPTTIKARIIGLLVCLPSLQAINLLRIISLLFLSRWSTPLFDFFHLYVWEALIVLESVLAFFFWMRWQGGPRPKPAAA